MMNIEGLERLTALGQRQRVSALFLNYKKFCSNFYKSLAPGRAAGGKRNEEKKKWQVI